MSATLLAIAPLIAALAGLAGLVALSVMAVGARSLFALIISLSAFGALSAFTALALGAPQAALALGLIGAALIPIFLMGVLLLSSRTAQRRKHARAWATPAAAAGLVIAIVAMGWDGALAPARAEHLPVSPLWLAALVIAAGAGAFGLLAYGERGALGGGDEESRAP